MYTICFSNEKGGVGKTTIATNVAYLIAERYQQRVLFVDNDKQGNSTSFFGVDTSNIPTIADFFVGEAALPEIVQHTLYQNIDLLPSDHTLAVANAQLQAKMAQEDAASLYSILRGALSLVAAQYAFCVIDNPPDHETAAVINALAATDTLVIVTPPTSFGLDGIRVILNDTKYARMLNPGFRIGGILVNGFKSSKSGYRFLDELESLSVPVYEHRIRYTPGWLNEALEAHCSIYEYCPQCGFARDLLTWLKEDFLTDI